MLSALRTCGAEIKLGTCEASRFDSNLGVVYSDYYISAPHVQTA